MILAFGLFFFLIVEQRQETRRRERRERSLTCVTVALHLRLQLRANFCWNEFNGAFRFVLAPIGSTVNSKINKMNANDLISGSHFFC